MHNFYIHKTRMVYFSFLIAILLQLIFYSLVNWRFSPSWVMMLLIYWITIFPKKINIGTGFTLGLIMDSIFGSFFGIYALSFSIISYLTVRRVYFFRHASILQQSFFVLFLSILDQSIKLLIQFFITQILYFIEIFEIGILNGIIWPFLICLMRRIYGFK